MPILLTTPFNPGTFDPDHTYPRAKIIHFTVSPENRTIRVVVDFGDVVDTKWVSGGAQGKEKSVMIRDADYTAIVDDSPQENEKTYDAVKRALYTYLAASVLELAGAIE